MNNIQIIYYVFYAIIDLDVLMIFIDYVVILQKLNNCRHTYLIILLHSYVSIMI